MIGHNAAAARIRSFVERVERLREEIAAINSDVSEVYKEAKAQGFDPKILKAVIQRRAKGQQATAEFDELLRLYEDALEEASGTPLATRVRAQEPPHNPDTGEIIELDRPGTSTAPVAEPESPDAESADAKAAPNVNAGPAAAIEAATSPANQDSAAPAYRPELDVPEFMRRTAAE